MAVLFSPFGNQQFSASGTALAVGHKIYTYAAGSSTPLATYTDSTGATPQSNPIILNTLGMPTSGQIWLTSGLSYKLVWTDASDVVIKTEDNISGVTGAASISQWQASGITPTYVGATSFTLPGDQTGEFQVGRRLQTSNTAGTVYSKILTSAYTTLTTVIVVNTAGVLDSGLSQVSYGLLSAKNPSIPGSVIVNVVEATPYTTYTSAGTAAIYDDTIPQISEGTALMSASITPSNINSRLRIEFFGNFGSNVNGDTVWIALFQDAIANALAASANEERDTNMHPIALVHEMAAGTILPTTFSIRFGSNGGTCYVNGNNAGRKFGGVSAARLRITEIL